MQDVEVIVFHSWNTSRVRIASVDETNCIVTFTGPTVFRPLAWDPDQRYYVENAADLLDAPGEWYLDRRTGTLSYWPHAGEDTTKAEVVAPRLTELLRFQGDPDKGHVVGHVRMVGLSFQHADWTLGEKGYGDPQAAVTIGAVISAEGAHHCIVEGCEVAHVGTYGVWFGRGSKDCRIVRNHIHDLGAGGVRIGSARMAKTDDTDAGRIATPPHLRDIASTAWAARRCVGSSTPPSRPRRTSSRSPPSTNGPKPQSSSLRLRGPIPISTSGSSRITRAPNGSR